jgi:SAM-dependent methyltransferase
MKNFWETLFESGKPIWDFHPSDSAIEAVNTFRENSFSKILIPGIGYGRNARLFLENGFRVTGIEISGSAIAIAKSYKIDCKIHEGSVTAMPYDDEIYDGIFCYALIHILNRSERKKFLESCWNQLKNNGIMIFSVVSADDRMCGNGKYLSRNRFEVSKGLKVFFYDSGSVEKEFSSFGLTDYKEINEPIKFKKDQPPIRMYYVVCEKR